jgi:hypothetical protein
MASNLTNGESPAGHSTFELTGVSWFADTFLVKEGSVLRTNIYAENPAHRKSAKSNMQNSFRQSAVRLLYMRNKRKNYGVG